MSIPSIPASVQAALDRGNKIEAIRLLREATGLGLKEAKDAVEHIEAGGAPALLPAAHAGGGESVAQALAQGKKLEAIRLYREQHGVDLKAAKDAIEAMQGLAVGTTPSTPAGLAPGEVRRSGGVGSGLMVLVLGIAIGALAMYLFVRPGA